MTRKLQKTAGERKNKTGWMSRRKKVVRKKRRFKGPIICPF